MMRYLLADIICRTFMKFVGKWQIHPQKKPAGTKIALFGRFEDGEFPVARFGTEDQAEAYRDSCFNEDRTAYRMNTLLEGCTHSDIRWQSGEPVNPLPHVPHAMKIVFKTTIDHRIEEGYRYLELVIYAPMNYVQVWTRTTWNVIPIEDLEDDNTGSGDTRVKVGKDYQTGESAWRKVADHDSCWRDSVRDLLREYEHSIQVFEGGEDWYTVVPVSGLGLPK